MTNQVFAVGDAIKFGRIRGELKHKGRIREILCDQENVSIFVKGSDLQLHRDTYLARNDGQETTVVWQVSELLPSGTDSAVSPEMTPNPKDRKEAARAVREEVARAVEAFLDESECSFDGNETTKSDVADDEFDERSSRLQPRQGATMESEGRRRPSTRSALVHGLNNVFTFLDETQVEWSSRSSKVMASSVAWLKAHKRQPIIKVLKACVLVTLAAITMPRSGDCRALIRETTQLMSRGLLLLCGDTPAVPIQDTDRRRTPLGATVNSMRMIQRVDDGMGSLADDLRKALGDAFHAFVRT